MQKPNENLPSDDAVPEGMILSFPRQEANDNQFPEQELSDLHQNCQHILLSHIPPTVVEDDDRECT